MRTALECRSMAEHCESIAHASLEETSGVRSSRWQSTGLAKVKVRGELERRADRNGIGSVFLPPAIYPLLS